MNDSDSASTPFSFAMTILASTFRWLQRKRYQYEVTFSLYMLTPTEKFIFSKPFLNCLFIQFTLLLHMLLSFQPLNRLTSNPTDSFIFLFFSMILIAASLYLPQHIAFLTNRAWFYYHGDEGLAAAAASTVARVAKATAAVPGMPEKIAYTGTAAGAAKGWSHGDL